MKKTKFLRSAAVLSVGGILAKGIGAIYRIPLTGIVGGYGMGLYQMAYPLFCVLLTFSSAGIPAAFSRMIARETAKGADCRGTVLSALRLFAALGLCGSLVMCVLAPRMSEWQGESGLVSCYLCLAPSVFLVALIAVIRGYFQGRNNMVPTAVSEIVEQAVKAALGLLLAYRYRAEPIRAVSFCLLAVTLSEAAALCYLLLRYRAEPRRIALTPRRIAVSDILLSALPVMASGALLPLSQTVDSVLIVRLLSAQTESAVSLYGLFAGSALSLINLPATLCYGISAASVPSVSAGMARAGAEEARRRALGALAVTMLLALPCAAGTFLFAGQISRIYPSLPAGERETLATLIRLLSVSAATLSGVNTLAACLTGMGRAGKAAGAMLLAVLAKFALERALVPVFSIGGAAIAANVCYLIAFFLDLIYTVKKPKEKAYDHGRKSRNGAGGSLPAGEGGAVQGGRNARANRRGSVGADA